MGTIHSVKGRIVPCENGLHGSEKPLDALKYAPGAIVWKTRHWGMVQHEDDKLCSTYREYVSGGIDASDTLRSFARWCALQVYDKIARYDPDGVIKKWLETGDEALRSAADSASDSAVELAASSAAWSASKVAAWSAAELAACSTAWSAQNKKLSEMLEALIDIK